MGANLIVGSSHSVYFSEAFGSLDATWDEASKDIVPIRSTAGSASDNHLLFTTNRPGFMELRQGASGEIEAAYGPLIEKVRRFNDPGSKVVFAIGGNEHNIRFLCRNPKPFDFFHASRPVMDASRQILPAREMRALLERLLERTFVVTRLLAAEVPLADRSYLPPPPPIPSEEHIRKNPEIFDFQKYVLEDAGVRLKIYNLYIEIVRAFCARQGLRFLEPPGENRDEEGFLREPFWYGATHASPEYYRGVVADLGL